MQKKIVWLFVVCSIYLVCSTSAQQGTTGSTSNAIKQTGNQGPILQGILEKGSQDQDFYKTTVQAYKDFNEQTVKYFSLALAVVSVLVTVFVTWFFFMFRKTLAEIRTDLSRDADRLRDVYSRTFDLLTEQAKTNLEIFKSRESELKTAIQEAQNLYENIRGAIKEISDNQRVREPVAENLAEEEVSKVQEKSKKIKDEVEDYKKDLEDLTKDTN